MRVQCVSNVVLGQELDRHLKNVWKDTESVLPSLCRAPEVNPKSVNLSQPSPDLLDCHDLPLKCVGDCSECSKCGGTCKQNPMILMRKPLTKCPIDALNVTLLD